MSNVTNVIIVAAVVIGVIVGFMMGRTTTAPAPAAGVASSAAPQASTRSAVTAPPVAVKRVMPAKKPAVKVVEKRAVPAKKTKKHGRARASRRPVIQAAIGLPLPAPQAVEAEELRDYSVPGETALPAASTETMPQPAEVAVVRRVDGPGDSAPELTLEDDDGHFGVKEYREEPVTQKRDMSTSGVDLSDR